jgi:hypothetical protein
MLPIFLCLLTLAFSTLLLDNLRNKFLSEILSHDKIEISRAWEILETQYTYLSTHDPTIPISIYLASHLLLNEPLITPTFSFQAYFHRPTQWGEEVHSRVFNLFIDTLDVDVILDSADYYHDRALRGEGFDPVCHRDAYSHYSDEIDRLPFYNVYQANAAIEAAGRIDVVSNPSREEEEEEEDLEILHIAIGLLRSLVHSTGDESYINDVAQFCFPSYSYSEISRCW